ncbi:MAG TPA: ATP-binding protein [Vicinamibacterales bacterium]|nr:ATP-binding protein [Vicinamibacterales bacterium]
MSDRRRTALNTAVASLTLAAGLGLVGWFDYSSTRREMLTLLVDQAASLRQAIAVAASAGEAASAQARTALTARLLDNARLLDRLDLRGGLRQSDLDQISESYRLFRVTVFSSSGQPDLTSGRSGPLFGAGRGLGPGLGQGARQGLGQGLGAGRRGRGPGAEAAAGGGPRQGPGSAMAGLAERLLQGGEGEAVSDVHASRWDRGSRLAAGVRRTRGGAIVLNVEAGELAALADQASLEHVLEAIAARAPDIAYVALEDGPDRLSFGPLASAAGAVDASARAPFTAVPLPSALQGLAAARVSVDAAPVLEFSGPADFARPDSPVLRLGLSLDGLRRAERRTLARSMLSLAAALTLGVLAIAFVLLRRRYGALSVRHARAEEALRRRDRLAAMGELASTVAHEVRNPLNAIGMTAQRLRHEFTGGGGAPAQDPNELEELLDVLSGETRRIDRIVQQFLDYARPPRLAPRRASLRDAVLEAAERQHARAATRGVTIVAEAESAGEAVFDADQLKQALDNLVRNAVDASPDGGRVVLAARPHAGGHVIEVTDEGTGIPPDVLPRIFDLYFTTKADGTGVGLAVTHQIVDAHRGRIDVESAPGRGTRMSVHLPADAELPNG